MDHFSVRVNYRTASGCSSKLVHLDATSYEEALQKASDKVRRQRGVLRIDGGDAVKVKPQ